MAQGKERERRREELDGELEQTKSETLLKRADVALRLSRARVEGSEKPRSKRLPKKRFSEKRSLSVEA